MSCPLLDQLAPETRNLIYAYALTFDAPLKHVHKMRPFVEKSAKNTGSIDSIESNESKAETASSEEPSTVSSSFNHVNISILTTSKLIYKEAIAMFYKHNTINIEASMCRLENVLALHTTDLSLATHVTVESVLKVDPQDGKFDGLGVITTFASVGFPLIFPKLKTVTVYVNTDAHPLSVSALLALTAKLKSTPGFAGVKFDGVGSAVAYPILPPDHPKFKLVLRCQTTVARWANGKIPDDDDVMSMSTRVIYDYCKTHNPPGTVDPIARSFFNRAHDAIVPIDYPVIEPDSYEFWTVADEGLRHMQLDFQRQQQARRAPIEDASSDSDSDSDYSPSSEEEDDDDDEDASEDDESAS